MTLSLKIVSYKGKPLPEPTVAIFDSGGGTIGRSDDNTLVLPDPEKFVSRHHATVSYENDTYVLTDTSLGGVYFDNEEESLHNAKRALYDGTRLKIGEYEIETIIDQEPASDDFAFSDIFAEQPPEASNSLTQQDEFLVSPFESEPNALINRDESPFVSHEELIDSGKPDQPDFESQIPGHASPLYDSFIAPSIDTTPPPFEEIPENLSFEDLFSDSLAEQAGDSVAFNDVSTPLTDELSVDKASPSPALTELPEQHDEQIAADDTPLESDLAKLLASDSEPVVARQALEEPAPVVQPSPRELSSESDLFAAFVQGAGIEKRDITVTSAAEAMQRIGRMFRQFVAGTVAVLRSRAEFKSLFRVNVTVIRAADNNPLKFAVTIDDVVKQLIQNKDGGFLESVESIEQGFDDIMDHQLAMQAGIQAALADLLNRFDPKTIEKQFEQGIVLQKKAKCWDSYRETFRIESEDVFENFFGDAFVEAYEQQMRALAAARKKS